MSAKIILIDSNLLVYAINSSSPKHKTAQVFLRTSIGHMAIAHQNIFESLRVLTHPKFQVPMSAVEAVAAVSAITSHCHVIAPDYETHEVAIALIKKYGLSGNKIFDAYLAATALSIGVQTIVTDNTKDFVLFKEISVINPFI